MMSGSYNVLMKKLSWTDDDNMQQAIKGLVHFLTSTFRQVNEMMNHNSFTHGITVFQGW